MSEVTETKTPLKTQREIRNSQFGKTEKRFEDQGYGYTAGFDSKDGGLIGAYRSVGNASLLQEFKFDTNGELQAVSVEKRLLSRAPTSAEELVRLAQQQEQEKETPAYAVLLEREADGKFVIKRRVTSGTHPEWKKTYKPEDFRKDTK